MKINNKLKYIAGDLVEIIALDPLHPKTLQCGDIVRICGTYPHHDFPYAIEGIGIRFAEHEIKRVQGSEEDLDGLRHALCLGLPGYVASGQPSSGGRFDCA